MTAPSDPTALVAELIALSSPERVKHGVPQDVAMAKAAALIEQQAATIEAVTKERDEARALGTQLALELGEQREATAFADENRSFQLGRVDKLLAENEGLRALLAVNNDPPKPGFHCACAFNQQTAQQMQECVFHADLRARAEKAEREWDAVLKSARFWEERHYAEMDAIAAALPGVRFMDPPDGGSPTLDVQVGRMSAALTAAEAERDRLVAEEREACALAIEKLPARVKEGGVIDLVAFIRRAAAAIRARAALSTAKERGE